MCAGGRKGRVVVEVAGFRIQSAEDNRMTETLKTGNPKPDSCADDKEPSEELVNDSLGTTNIADSTGLDECKETGDAKVGIKDKKPQD